MERRKRERKENARKSEPARTRERGRGREMYCKVARFFFFFSFLCFVFFFSFSLSRSLSPARSSFQCRCWQQQQCSSSSSHVNSEEYHHCSDLRNSEIFFLSSLTKFPVCLRLSVYDLRFSTCTYSPRCLSNEFLPCPVKLRPLRYPYHRKQRNPDAWL